MILKDAYNFYSSKLFLHPYNSKVLQRLGVFERVSGPGHSKARFGLQISASVLGGFLISA